jgi:hypothetical protein
MAMISPLITTEIIDVERFPALGDAYRVAGVPKMVINDRISFEGAAPEEFVVEKILSLNRP